MSYEQAVVNLQETNAELVKAVNRVRDAAMGMNRMYSSTSAGVAAVQDGEYFVVPGGGVYQRLYQRSGGSASLIAEYPDKDQLGDVITQLGPLLGRGVVGGSGDLLAEGAYGIGSIGIETWPESSLDAANIGGGLYYVEGATEQPPSSSPRGVLLHRTAGSAGAQIHISDASPLELHARPCRFGTWREWQKIYHSRNILGTVSQSDGVPTGAIIERGSNANGEYVKFADGSLICRTQRNLGSIVAVGSGTTSSPYRTGSVTIDFPATFSVVGDMRPQVALHPQIFTASTTEGDVRVASSRPSNDGKGLGIVRVTRNNNDATDHDVWLSVLAIGRWYN
jgi:hypothetical protein